MILSILKISEYQLRSVYTLRFFLVRVRYSFNCHQVNAEKIGPSPNLSMIQTANIGTSLNF